MGGLVLAVSASGCFNSFGKKILTISGNLDSFPEVKADVPYAEPDIWDQSEEILEAESLDERLSKDKSQNNAISAKAKERTELIKLVRKHYDHYLTFLDAVHQSKGKSDKPLEAIADSIFHREHDGPFKREFEKHYQSLSKAPMALIAAEMILDSYFKKHGLYLIAGYVQTPKGMFIIPRLYSSFEEKKKKTVIFGDSLAYTQIILKNNLLKDINKTLKGKSWTSNEKIHHEFDSYERLYGLYKKILTKQRFKDKREELEINYAKRLFGDIMKLPEKESKKRFIDMYIHQVENYFAPQQLIEKIGLKITHKSKDIKERIHAQRQWFMINQLYETENHDFTKFWFLRSEKNPIMGPGIKEILPFYNRKGVKDFGVEDFCKLDNKVIKDISEGLYKRATQAYKLYKKQKSKPKPKIWQQKDEKMILCYAQH